MDTVVTLNNLVRYDQNLKAYIAQAIANLTASANSATV